MNSEELKRTPQELIIFRMENQNKMVKFQIWQSCLNCLDWGGKSEICMKFKARPPAEIIVSGCPDWIDDIPF